MYFYERICLPLALATLCLASGDSCPIDAIEVVIVKTIVPVEISPVPSISDVVPNQPIASTTVGVTGPSILSSAALSMTAEPKSTSATLIPQIRSSSLTVAVPAPSSHAGSSTTSASETFYGLGTRYGTNECTEYDCWQNGACSFVDYTLPAGIDGTTCVSSDIWNNGANCGGCISVTYKGKTITVMVGGTSF